MDEKAPHQTPTSTHTTINHSAPKPAAGNGVMWFMLGGIVIAVAVVAYFVMGNGVMTTSGSSAPAGGNVSVNVETTAAPAPEDAPATESAPAGTSPTETAPAEAAPAETAPAAAPPAD